MKISMKLPTKFLILIVLITISVSTALAHQNTFHIVLDPGHGGNDLGATRDSFVESKIVLQIAKKIKTILDKQKNITTTLTRADKSGLSLKKRVLLAHELKADLFISLHANTSNSKSIQGMEFYFNSQIPKSLKTSTNIKLNAKEFSEVFSPSSPTATEVISKIKADFEFYDKTQKSLLLTKTFKEKSSSEEQKSTIKRAPFYVIDHTSMPSALIELGFISNRREAKKLASEEHQNKIANLLTSALLEYKEMEYKEKSDKLNAL